MSKDVFSLLTLYLFDLQEPPFCVVKSQTIWVIKPEPYNDGAVRPSKLEM